MLVVLVQTCVFYFYIFFLSRNGDVLCFSFRRPNAYQSLFIGLWFSLRTWERCDDLRHRYSKYHLNVSSIFLLLQGLLEYCFLHIGHSVNIRSLKHEAEAV